MSGVIINTNITVTGASIVLRNKSIWDNCTFEDCCLQAFEKDNVELINCKFNNCTFTGDGWPDSVKRLSE